MSCLLKCVASHRSPIRLYLNYDSFTQIHVISISPLFKCVFSYNLHNKNVTIMQNNLTCELFFDMTTVLVSRDFRRYAEARWSACALWQRDYCRSNDVCSWRRAVAASTTTQWRWPSPTPRTGRSPTMSPTLKPYFRRYVDLSSLSYPMVSCSEQK